MEKGLRTCTVHCITYHIMSHVYHTCTTRGAGVIILHRLDPPAQTLRRQGLGGWPRVFRIWPRGGPKPPYTCLLLCPQYWAHAHKHSVMHATSEGLFKVCKAHVDVARRSSKLRWNRFCLNQRLGLPLIPLRSFVQICLRTM